MVNDGSGHLAGDALLFQTAQRLESCLNIEHLLARVGGDEFAVWLPNLKDSQEAIALADLFQKELTEPFFGKEKKFVLRSVLALRLINMIQTVNRLNYCVMPILPCFMLRQWARLAMKFS